MRPPDLLMMSSEWMAGMSDAKACPSGAARTHIDVQCALND